MPLEKIPAILLGGLGIHVAVTAPTPPTPKNERKIRDGPVDINWVARGMKASSFLLPKYTEVTNVSQGYVLDDCSHRALRHCGGGNDVRVHLAKASCGSPVAKWKKSGLH